MRNFENEFIDFQPGTVDEQFRSIYGDLAQAYRRGDKVTLSRSLSGPMFKYVSGLLQERKPSPFHKQVGAAAHRAVPQLQLGR